MKNTRTIWFIGALVLMTTVISACGRSSNSTDATPEALPTDGILGELPKAIAEYEAAEAAYNAQYKELKNTDPEKAKAFKKEHDAQNIRAKFKKETQPALEKTLEGKEIPVEVADGVPLKLDKNLTLDAECHATTTGVYTAEAKSDKKYYDYSPIAYDSDGNPIARLENYVSMHAEEGKTFNLFYKINISDYNAASWAHLKKIIIMDKDSEEFKQAEATIKANKEAFKNAQK